MGPPARGTAATVAATSAVPGTDSGLVDSTATESVTTAVSVGSSTEPVHPANVMAQIAKLNRTPMRGSERRVEDGEIERRVMG
jgi:hypothetical protein